VGGYNLQPPGSPALSTLYAVHTISGRKGLIFFAFAGAYNLNPTPMVVNAHSYQPFGGQGTWVINGGTGAYAGLMGQGIWTADSRPFPYIRETEEGQVWRLDTD
jgi:hypothetical protein